MLKEYKANRLRYVLSWITVIALQLFIPYSASAKTLTDGEKDLIRMQARYDAIDDFQYQPWLMKWGGGEFCALFLITGSGLVPDYPYRSKLLEFALISGLPAYLVYKRPVSLPIKRSNQIVFESSEYRTIYTKEYQTAAKQLRIVNTYIGTGLYSITFMLVKALLPS